MLEYTDLLKDLIMDSIPEDKTLYRIFEEQCRQVLPESLVPHFEDDIHDLVSGVKDIIKLTLERNPDASIDPKKQVIYKLESWRTSKVKHLAYARYCKFIEENKLTSKTMSFMDFVDKHYYKKWLRIEELKIKRGVRIRVKGYGDLYTVKGISAHLSIAVDEISKHFNPDQIISVVEG